MGLKLGYSFVAFSCSFGSTCLAIVCTVVRSREGGETAHRDAQNPKGTPPLHHFVLSFLKSTLRLLRKTCCFSIACRI